jgi:DNA-binding GntR family transcriptional regulator
MNANDDGDGIVVGDLNSRSRRLTSKLEAARVSGPDGEYKSLTQIVVSKLRQSIFDGSIFDGEYGPGSRLNITDLAKRLDVSPIPVREALRLLEAEQLVEFRLNRGVVVRELSAGELRELFLVRRPLETLAATEAARWRSEKSLQALESILRRMDAAGPSDTWRVLHERFHQELYALANLPRLSQMIIGLRGQMRPYAKLYNDDPEQVRHVQAEHYALLKALRKRDGTSIYRILHEHLSRPARLALSKLGAAKEMTSDFAGP